MVLDPRRRVVATPYGVRMRLVHLRVENFRGISTMEWSTDETIICLVGPGDVGKSTVLEAVDWTLGSRWALPVSDADFTNLDVDSPIVVEATIADVPQRLLTDQTFQHHARYRCAAGMHDEPQHGDDQAVLTVRLQITDTLEPQWEVTCGERLPPRSISGRDRAAFGATRLGGDPDRQLRWARGSALDRLTEETAPVTQALAGVYRTARTGVTDEQLQPLDDAVAVAREAIPTFGAGVDAAELRAALDPAAFTPAVGALALHSGEVPLTGSGLGTRRLAALAIQAASVPEGAIILADEIEAGLEPHRLRHLLRLLRLRIEADKGPAPGQVLMTTHSPITVVELRASELAVARRTADGVTLSQPTDELQGVIRSQPEAMLATAVIVGEGLTEQGLVRGLDEAAAVAGETPLAHRGVAVVSGGGCTRAPGVAIELAGLGYRAAILVDSDQPIVPDAAEVLGHGVHVAQWADTMCTEQRIASDVSLTTLVGLLGLISEEVVEPAQVRGDVAAALERSAEELPEDLLDWSPVVGETDFRTAVGTAMARGKWLKQIAPAESAGRYLGPALPDLADTNLGQVLANLWTWTNAT